MFDDFKSCYNRLLFLDNIIEQIIQKIGAGNIVDGREKSDAQGLLGELKGELQKDCDFMKNRNVRDTLSDIDSYFYYPTIQKALSCISVKPNSEPDQRWSNQLYDAQIELRDCMDKIENYL